MRGANKVNVLCSLKVELYQLDCQIKALLAAK